MFLPVETELEGSFTVTEKTRLSQESAPCEEDQNYSFSDCIAMYIARLVGCKMERFSLFLGSELSQCSEKSHMIRFNTETTRLLLTSWKDLTLESGCPAKCFMKHFKFSKVKEEVANWRRFWSSAFYLQPESTMVWSEKEYLMNQMLSMVFVGLWDYFLAFHLLYYLFKRTN